ncbi:MAG: thioredoxin family protein [Rhizomicrobium sp.]
MLANEAGANSIVAVLGAMIAFALAAWIWTTSRNSGPRGRGFGAFATLLALLAMFGFLSFLLQATPATTTALTSAEGGGIPHEAYSAVRLEQLRKEGRPVFVNATAAWCITCLVNERVAFSSGAVADALAKHHVAYLIADWTRRDPEITKLLEVHGRDGVPLYLYYAPHASDATVLPQILTADAVLQAVGR